uniref:Nucleoside diphosphate kinase-like domain-containing protein n=1 Tax=Zonotrichia albicollis TaxID=44394 RepID=A0A8D2QE73_ZONAL
MAGKKKEVHHLFVIPNYHLLVIEVYQAWCGPCKAVQNLLRKLRIDFSEDNVLHFAAVRTQILYCMLQNFKALFSLQQHGKIIAMVKGVNAPLITKIVTDLVEEERQIAAGEKERAEVLTNQILMHKCIFLLHLHCFSKSGFGIEADEERMLTEEQIKVFYSRKKDEETESLVNLCDVQDSIEDASRQLAFFFPNFHIEEGGHAERTLAIIRPKLLKERRDSIIQRIQDDGFQIAMQKEIILTEEQVRTFYQEHVDQDYFPVFLEHMISGPTLILALTRENAVAHWRSLLGPKILEEAKENPESLRAEFAFEHLPINQLHGSSTPSDAQKELQFFFPEEHTFAVIKPDAATPKDEILKKVKEAGFNIAKIKEQALTREMALHFYKDHEGKPFFDDLVNFMTQGPSVIMVLTKENAVEEWKKLMGPTDPEEAKKTCPESIRAQFANDILANSVYGSSDIEQAERNIQFVFGELDAD